MPSNSLHVLVRKGETPLTWNPGDVAVVFDHKPTLVHEAIQCRERVTCGHTAWANLTHLVCITGEDGSMIEANAPGIQAGNMRKYQDMRYWVINTGATKEQRELCVKRWLQQVGHAYDYIAFGGEAAIAFGFALSVHQGGWFICSGLGCFGLLTSVVSFPIPFEQMTPAEVAKFYNLPIADPWVKPNFTGRMLDRIAFAVRFITHPVRKKS